MTAELKFHSTIISITTLFMFSLWKYTSLLETNYPWLSVAVAGVMTLGIYRGFSAIVLMFFRKNKMVKKFFLGPYYMEGIWVGFFVGHQNKIRYIVEAIEQGLSELVIRGQVFRDDKTYHCSYTSQDASINLKEGRLSYSYNADTIGNTHINPGLARFDLGRTSKDSSPDTLTGYSSDLFHPNKLMAFEEKLPEKLNLSIPEQVEEAIKVYKKYIKLTGTNLTDDSANP